MFFKIENLKVRIKGNEKTLPILDDISIEIPPQTIFALVGGSGSGKTTTGLSMMQLLSPALEIVQGTIHFQGNNLLNYSPIEMRRLRGKEIGMIFQEPLYAFNPVYRIGFQIEEVLKCHTPFNHQERQEKIYDLLRLVGLNEPKRIINSYSHQLSGGMRQRAMIAQAIVAHPKLLIADEPTSNLDVTLQAKIMDLFLQLKNQLKLSILLISHDLGMVSHLADEIAVMMNGKIVERGKTKDILQNPQHVYTRQLMEAMV